MRKGEKVVIALMISSVALMAWYKGKESPIDDKNLDVPFYSTASKDVADRAGVLIRQLNCRNCHSLWGVRDLSQAVPAPALDGMGMFRDEKWLFDYFSSDNPQEILSSRLKPEYRMPSFSSLSVNERQDLASYIASLKVYDWYFEDAKKARYEKLTGEDYKPNE